MTEGGAGLVVSFTASEVTGIYLVLCDGVEENEAHERAAASLSRLKVAVDAKH